MESADELKERGITISQSYDVHCHNNYISQYGTGIRLAGDVRGSRFYCNELNACRSGFYFVPASGTVATYISDQLGGLASNNSWINAQNYRLNGDIVSPNLNLVNWYFSGVGGSSSQMYNPQVTMNLTPSPLNSKIDPHSYTYNQQFCGAGTEDPAFFERMAQGPDSLFTALYEELQYQALEYSYDYLLDEQAQFSDATAQQNYLNLLEQSRVPEYREVMELIREQGLAQALNRNSRLWEENALQTNQRLVQDIYLRSVALGDSLPAPDTLLLRSLATTTPYVGGFSVFSARVLMDIFPFEEGLVYKGGAQQTENEEELKWSLYPNPSVGKVILRPDAPLDEQLLVEIFDINGRLMGRFGKYIRSSAVALDLGELQEGWYIIKVKHKSGVEVFKHRIQY
jgi:hypothetical protein